MGCGYTINIVVDNIQFVMTIIIIILSVLKNHGQKNLGEKNNEYFKVGYEKISICVGIIQVKSIITKCWFLCYLNLWQWQRLWHPTDILLVYKQSICLVNVMVIRQVKVNAGYIEK